MSGEKSRRVTRLSTSPLKYKDSLLRRDLGERESTRRKSKRDTKRKRKLKPITIRSFHNTLRKREATRNMNMTMIILLPKPKLEPKLPLVPLLLLKLVLLQLPKLVLLLLPKLVPLQLLRPLPRPNLLPLLLKSQHKPFKRLLNKLQ